MKKIMCLVVFSSTLLNAQTNNNVTLQGVSFFSPRSQSADAARYAVGWQSFTHRAKMNNSYATLKATPEYTMSYHPERIAQALFGTDKLYISGSQVEFRDDQALLADYFGLSPEFQSYVYLKPKIKNVIVTFSAYIGFDQWVPGLYCTINAPAVWTQWNFDIEESITSPGNNIPFPPDYMNDTSVSPAYHSFKEAFQGNKSFGQVEQRTFGNVCGVQSKGGLADLIMILGYDIVSHERGYAGFYLRAAAPTGNRPNSRFFFEPIVGNGKHWECGLGFAGKGVVWEADDTQKVSFVGELYMTHLFKSKQVRSFDFCLNGFGSRFILLKEFDAHGMYTGTSLPAINVTSLCCDVSVAMQFELLAMISYTDPHWEFDLGYNAWIRSREKITLRECIAHNKYGFKGIQNVAMLGFPSNITQSTATLHGNPFSDQALVADVNSPRFINTNNLNLSSAGSPTVFTHKLFLYLGYSWQEKPHAWCVPYFGGGTSIEFEGINTSNTVQPNDNTLNQWGVWINGGVAFS